MDRISVPVEIRASDDGPKLYATLMAEGRAARTRREVFAPGSIIWPAGGIAIRTVHLGPEVARTIPERVGTEIRIACPATPEIHAAFHHDGLRELSCEFHPLAECRTAAGVREVQQALVTGAALVKEGDYGRQTGAEIRATARRRVWL